MIVRDINDARICTTRTISPPNHRQRPRGGNAVDDDRVPVAFFEGAVQRDAHGARFVLSEGVLFVAQPDGAVAAARAATPSDPWRLGAVSLITTLTGSALIALAVAAGELEVEQAWAAAHVDEDWNMDFWGRDELAMQRRAARFADMQAAGTVLALTR